MKLSPEVRRFRDLGRMESSSGVWRRVEIELLRESKGIFLDSSEGRRRLLALWEGDRGPREGDRGPREAARSSSVAGKRSELRRGTGDWDSGELIPESGVVSPGR